MQREREREPSRRNDDPANGNRIFLKRKIIFDTLYGRSFLSLFFFVFLVQVLRLYTILRAMTDLERLLSTHSLAWLMPPICPFFNLLCLAACKLNCDFWVFPFLSLIVATQIAGKCDVGFVMTGTSEVAHVCDDQHLCWPTM